MLGMHPQMYGLPETHIFREETVSLWLQTAGTETFEMADGLLRAVAQSQHWGWRRPRWSQ